VEDYIQDKVRRDIIKDILKKWLFPEEIKYTPLLLEPERKVTVVKKTAKKPAAKKKAPVKKTAPAKKTAPKKTTKKSTKKK